MGTGASAGVSAGMAAAVQNSSNEELKAVLKGMKDDDIKKLTAAISEVKGATGTYTLVYHGGMKSFLGRGWAPLMILEEGKAKDSITFECKAPGEVEVPVTFAPPMVMTPSGAKVAQSSCVCAQLGKELGFWPAGAAADAKAFQLCVDATDMLAEAFAGKPANRMEKWLSHFDKALEQSGGPFLFGDKLTSVDYIVFQSVAIATGKCADAKVPDKISNWLKLMKEQKGFKAVDAMGLPLTPP